MAVSPQILAAISNPTAGRLGQIGETYAKNKQRAIENKANSEEAAMVKKKFQQEQMIVGSKVVNSYANSMLDWKSDNPLASDEDFAQQQLSSWESLDDAQKEFVPQTFQTAKQLEMGKTQSENTLKSFEPENWKTKAKDSPWAKINPSQYTQKSIKKFEESGSRGDLVARDKESLVTNIIGQGESELSKSVNKYFGRDLIERRNNAIDAKNSLIATNDAINLLDSGIITGTGATYVVEAGKALRRMGVDYFEDDVANTEAYYANQAKQVAQVIKAFGAGTGLSDADREYAEKAAAGKITMSEKSLRKIIEMNQKASRNLISKFNEDVSKMPKGVTPFDLSIKIPDMQKAIKDEQDYGDMEQKDIDRLKELRNKQGAK